MHGKNNMTYIVSVVVAMNKQSIIGVNNTLPWHIPEDLKHFKQITTGKPVIMGRKTFESIGKPLLNRTNIVITNNQDFNVPNVVVFNSLQKAINNYSNIDEICIIGGGEIFKQAFLLHIVDKIYLTLINKEVSVKNAVFFPHIDWGYWKAISTKNIISEDGTECTFYDYVKN